MRAYSFPEYDPDRRPRRAAVIGAGTAMDACCSIALAPTRPIVYRRSAQEKGAGEDYSGPATRA